MYRKGQWYCPEKPGFPIEDAEAGGGDMAAARLPNLLAAADPTKGAVFAKWRLPQINQAASGWSTTLRHDG